MTAKDEEALRYGLDACVRNGYGHTEIVLLAERAREDPHRIHLKYRRGIALFATLPYGTQIRVLEEARIVLATVEALT